MIGDDVADLAFGRVPSIKGRLQAGAADGCGKPAIRLSDKPRRIKSIPGRWARAGPGAGRLTNRNRANYRSGMM